MFKNFVSLLSGHDSYLLVRSVKLATGAWNFEVAP